jgi:hypothetical protein
VTFVELNASFTDLRDGVRAQAGREAFGDLNIRPPAGEADEASFLRLIAWCYSLLFEAGRITVPFLLDLNLREAIVTGSQRHKEARVMVQYLRTIMFHNLGFDEEHDVNIRKAVSDWFLETCGAVFPNSAAEWNKCFERLCNSVRDLVAHCSLVLSVVASSPEDRETILKDLGQRLNRDWEAHQFDRMIEDAASRLGERINARAFRERRLNDWRRFLAALPEEADAELEMERLIDGEIADHFRSRSPVRTRELMDVLGLDPGPEVKRAMEIAQGIFESGVRDRDELLAKVRAAFFANGAGG